MAVVQGLTHYVTLGMAGTMRRLGVTPEDTMAFMSPIYQIEMSLVGRLLSQDPDLYADILMLNPAVPRSSRHAGSRLQRFGRPSRETTPTRSGGCS